VNHQGTWLRGTLELFVLFLKSIGKTKITLSRFFSKNKPGMVMHDFSIHYTGGRDKKIVIKYQLRQKQETLSEKQTKKENMDRGRGPTGRMLGAKS
jgi:hypothetical protein